MSDKNTFIMYTDAINYTEGLSYEQMGMLYKAQLQYANGIEPEIVDSEVKGIFRVIKHFMSLESEKYDSKCRQMRANATKSKQKQTDAIPINQMQADDSQSVQIEGDNDNDNENDNDIKEKTSHKGESKEKAPKHKHGQYAHVLLTDEELERLIAEYGEEETKAAIDFLDEYIERKPSYRDRSHNLAIRKWVFKAIREERIRQQEMAQREERLKGQPKANEARAGIRRKDDLDACLLQDVKNNVGAAAVPEPEIPEPEKPPDDAVTDDLAWLRDF